MDPLARLPLLKAASRIVVAALVASGLVACSTTYVIRHVDGPRLARALEVGDTVQVFRKNGTTRTVTITALTSTQLIHRRGAIAIADIESVKYQRTSVGETLAGTTGILLLLVAGAMLLVQDTLD